MGRNLALTDEVMSWGRYPRHLHYVQDLRDRRRELPRSDYRSLPFGNGRSYGDVCLNDHGVLLRTRNLDRYIDFDPAGGLLRCESGVLLKDILGTFVSRGWFLPVTPGTKFVTVGGAVANDVHGKNHHRVGSFGRFVRRLELLRSDGTRLTCSATENADWFAATLGGLGLTGLITWVELQLKPIANAWMLGETWRFDAAEEFFRLSRESERDYEYTVAWIDCADKAGRGRGLFMRANHAPADESFPGNPRRKNLRVPFTSPFALVNRLTLPAFNWAYFHGSRADGRPRLEHYDPFFYPLDSILEWNRLYGPRGFLQYQCVVPKHDAEASVCEMLRRIAGRGAGSFLAVLKSFGDMPSLGMMSFPRSGVTLALDFSIAGESTFALLDELDHVVMAAGGAVYPAKDARMGREIFRAGFPEVDRFAAFVDPAFSSSFWRRMGF